MIRFLARAGRQTDGFSGGSTRGPRGPKKKLIFNPCEVMEGWILSGVSAPHGVRVQEEGLRCARSAQSTVDVFTTSADKLVFFKSSPNVQRRKGNRVAAIIKESPSDTILFRAIFKGVAPPSPLQVDVQLR